MTRSTFVLALVLGLSACGSNPVEDRYYSLVLAADDASEAIPADAATPVLLVGPVQLPEYLQRRGLALQVGANEIQTANHHFWAEPLDEAIAKVLVRDISSRTGGIVVERDVGRWTEAGDCRLRIEFDKFHATDRARVVSSGRYWLSASASAARQEFDMTQTIAADGYAHAVTALRQSLRNLAAQIADDMQSSSACSGRPNDE